jgi:hypothetical protein
MMAPLGLQLLTCVSLVQYSRLRHQCRLSPAKHFPDLFAYEFTAAMESRCMATRTSQCMLQCYGISDVALVTGARPRPMITATTSIVDNAHWSWPVWHPIHWLSYAPLQACGHACTAQHSHCGHWSESARCMRTARSSDVH